MSCMGSVSGQVGGTPSSGIAERLQVRPLEGKQECWSTDRLVMTVGTHHRSLFYHPPSRCEPLWLLGCGLWWRITVSAARSAWQ